MNLIYRRAKSEDLKSIVKLLIEDSLGKTREKLEEELSSSYTDAFNKINNDPNHYLMVVYNENDLIATCHLNLLHSLTFTGSTRMQIEAVRVRQDERGQGVGKKMINVAINWGKENGATIIQLTTNKQRVTALKFYEDLGFEGTHEGMKLYLS